MPANCYIKVYAYMHAHTGFGSQKPVAKYDLSLVQMLVPEGQEPIVKVLGNQLDHEELLREIAIWLGLLQCEVKYFREKRVTTVTEEEVEGLPIPTRRGL